MKKRLYILPAFVLAMVLSVVGLIDAGVVFADEEIISTPMPTEFVEDVELTLGDINLDDKINAKDALLTLKYAAKIIDFQWHEVSRADVNKSGDADATDALNILKYSAGIIESFDEIVVPTIAPTETVKPTDGPSGYELVDALNMDFDYYNSFIAEVEVEEDTNFTTENFPELPLTEVWTRGKIKTENAYIYQLIMVLDKATCNDDILKETMAKAEALEAVTKASYNWYYEHDTIIELNHSEYVLEVGESIDLNIADYRPYYQESGRVGIILKINGNTINGEELTEEAINKYGASGLSHGPYIPTGTSYWKQYEISTEIDYYLSVYNAINSEISHLKVAHLLSQIPEIEMVQVVSLSVPPSGERYYEYWNCSDEAIASMELSGGDEDLNANSSTTKLNQTATITALTLGEITISVTRGGWNYKEGTGTCVIKVIEKVKQEYVTEVDYDNTRVYTTTGIADEPYIGANLPDIRVITDYTEYKEYITNAKESLKSVNDNLEINIYSEDFFIDNSVVVIDYCVGDYSTEVYFSDVEQVEGKYKVNIEHHSNFTQSPMLRHWEIMIPIEGQECNAEDFEVGFINECEWYCVENDCGKAAPIVSESGQEYLEYPLVLSTYEEYEEYMALFKEANPNYAVKREYTEEDFESMKLVVGGFWAFSGLLDLEYSGIRTREDELIIDFDGTCPSPYTDDSYYYHFMLACDILDVSQYDVRWNIDVEYYE